MYPPYRLVVLDFDGTLADTFPWLTSVLNEVARRYAFRQVAPGEDEALRHLGAQQLLARLGVPSWKVPFIAAHLRRRMAQEIHAIRLFDGVEAMLHGLKARGARVAIASSNAEGNIRQVLGGHALRHIDAMECGVSISGKPARLKKLLRVSGVPAAAAIYIGDEIRDIAAARAAGMAAGAVAWGYNRPAVLRAQAPNFLFEDMGEIAQRVRP